MDGSDSDSDPGGWMSFGGTRSSVHKAQPANAILAPSKPLETLEKLQQMLEDSINAWIQKHLTPEELLSEGKDLIKLIKARI